MASSRLSSVTLLMCFCSFVVLLFLADGATALTQQTVPEETVVVGSAKELYLRGNLVIPNENPTQNPPQKVESFKNFARRELDDYTPSANCDVYVDPTCP